MSLELARDAARLGRGQHRLYDENLASTTSAVASEIDSLDVMMRSVDVNMDLAEPTPKVSVASARFAIPASSPIAIAMSPAMSRSRSRAREDRESKLQGLETQLTTNAAKKPKRRKKKPTKKAAESALHTIIGFAPTPIASGDDDSDLSPGRFDKQTLPSSKRTSLTSSPFLRPASSCGGISALRQQLDALDLEPVVQRSTTSLGQQLSAGIETPNSMTGSDSGIDVDGMTSYEVPLQHDFVSCDVETPREEMSTLFDKHIHRKMAAADFTTLKCLGKGTFGTVNMVKQVATGRLFAQKLFRKASLTVHKRLIEQTRTERAILESINRHPFVVKLYYAFQDHEKLYLILEYAQGGELFTHLANERMFSEATASFYMAEMVLALDHLHHTVGVVYRDLKPENCLLDADGHLLLTDFGLSKVAVDGADRCTSILGTVEYMAPEVIVGHAYGAAVDWWSLGALGVDLLTGSPPFPGSNHAKIQERIVRQKLALPYFLSPDAKDLLTRLLRKEPAKRLGGAMPRDMARIKEHRFFRRWDWARLERRDEVPPIRPLITDPELAENFAREFTEAPLSPVVSGGGEWIERGLAEEQEKDDVNPFGGFSFVGSRSLLEHEGYF